MRLAAAVEADSEHPLARAIVDAGTANGDDPCRVGGFRSIAGRGVDGEVDGSAVRGRWARPCSASVASACRPSSRGETATWRAGARRCSTSCATAGSSAPWRSRTQIRPESARPSRALHAEGVRVVMITGDARPVAEAVAAELGIDEVFAEVLPEDKDRAVASSRRRG